MPAIALMLLVEVAWPTGPRRHVLVGAASVVMVTAVLVAPWMIRNYFALGGFVPLRSNFGMELSFGNHPESTGSSNIDWSDPDMSSKMRHPHPNAAECRKLADMGEVAYMRAPASGGGRVGSPPIRGALRGVDRPSFSAVLVSRAKLFNNASLSTTVKIAGFGTISALMFLGLFLPG